MSSQRWDRVGAGAGRFAGGLLRGVLLVPPVVVLMTAAPAHAAVSADPPLIRMPDTSAIQVRIDPRFGDLGPLDDPVATRPSPVAGAKTSGALPPAASAGPNTGPPASGSGGGGVPGPGGGGLAGSAVPAGMGRLADAGGSAGAGPAGRGTAAGSGGASGTVAAGTGESGAVGTRGAGPAGAGAVPAEPADDAVAPADTPTDQTGPDPAAAGTDQTDSGQPGQPGKDEAAAGTAGDGRGAGVEATTVAAGAPLLSSRDSFAIGALDVLAIALAGAALVGVPMADRRRRAASFAADPRD